MTFEELGLSKRIIGLLKEQGISQPTSIQEQAIPALLEGRDVIGRAETGSGKTLAFVLPILERLEPSAPEIQALIVTPTRELAIQITAEIKKMNPIKDELSLLAVYGGQDVEKQLSKLKKGVHIVVGTPGRLLDHVRRGTLSLGHLRMLVLDEADQMLHFGFLNEVETLVKLTPKTRQTMLFSATMPDQVRSLSRRFMQHPRDIRIQETEEKKPNIKQLAIEVTDRTKFDKLCQIIDQFRPYLALVFCRTKRRASHVNEALLGKGYLSDELHGDLSQAKRERVMKRFRDAEIQILVATDVAARGLDVQGVTHVINYDLPPDTDYYIHRIGRTGRAGESGLAISFVGPREQYEFRRLLKAVEGQISWKALDGGSEPKERQTKSGQAASRKRQEDQTGRRGTQERAGSRGKANRPSERRGNAKALDKFGAEAGGFGESRGTGKSGRRSQSEAGRGRVSTGTGRRGSARPGANRGSKRKGSS